MTPKTERSARTRAAFCSFCAQNVSPLPSPHLLMPVPHTHTRTQYLADSCALEQALLIRSRGQIFPIASWAIFRGKWAPKQRLGSIVRSLHWMRARILVRLWQALAATISHTCDYQMGRLIELTSDWISCIQK